MTEWEGVFPLWKEAGMTSHDCVSRARKLFRMKRIGHTGTLDPDVSGVLPLCLGRATRIVEYLQELPKTYEAEMTIGYATDTEDASGVVIASAEQVDASEERIRETAARFLGAIEQTPPMYSAVKVEGKRLYELARAGQEVERQSRSVTIYRLDITDIRRDGNYIRVSMTVTCSKGTYIRTLCTDIGRALGYPAVMSALVRTASGPFRKESCVTFEEAGQLADEGILADKLVPIGEALSFLPKGIVSDAAVVPARQGRKLFFKAVRFDPVDTDAEDACLPARTQDDAPAVARSESGLVRLYGEDRWIGIYRRDESEECYIPVKLFT